MNESPNLNILKRQPRIFMEENIDLNKWENIAPYFNSLIEREINSIEDLHNWLVDRSELEAVMYENQSKIWINTTLDTNNAEYKETFNNYFTNIETELQRNYYALNKKLIACPFIAELSEDAFGLYIKRVKAQLEFYCEANVELNAQISKLSAKYGEISSAMTIEMEEKTITMQKAALYLKSPERAIREEAYNKIYKRRKQDEETLNTLFSDLLKIRHQVALNAGYENFRDFMFAELCRFDYNANDCFEFHSAIEKNIKPIAEKIYEERRKRLDLKELKPWDISAEMQGREPLKPFNGSDELISKSLHCFEQLHPYFASCVNTMKSYNHLDLESRFGKAPGGYMSHMPETMVPFIFMNGVGSLKDIITMVHECGHAFHDFLAAHQALVAFKAYPSEIAELASMSMELLTMDYWSSFFPNEVDQIRAKKEHLEDILTMLPWIATIDAFQHWIYTNPYHSIEERSKKWVEIYSRFHPSNVQWAGQEDSLALLWQKQLHLFEVPFYYIEYGMAQLGAIAVWSNYKKDRNQTLEQYMKALSMGYTNSIPKIYQEAGIKFDFSDNYVKDLAQFVNTELARLN